MAAPLIASTPQGLYCEEGGFSIDPWRPVDRAVVSHAHADHAVRGCARYLTSARGVPILAARMNPDAAIEGVPYGEVRAVGNVRLSLHPAGHVPGSAMIRVERIARSAHGPAGEAWLFTGDFKTARDPTCETFEPVPCHTMITESTFGLPIYRWAPAERVFAEINAWWSENRRIGRTSVVYAYALGKAQRLLAGVDPSVGPLGVHGSIERMNKACRAAGVELPPVVTATGDDAKAIRGEGLVVAPPSVAATAWLRRLGGREGVSTAFVSGWMAVRGARRRRAVDRGFVLSDHADWDGLLSAIRACGATRVGVTHGFSDALSRYVRETMGLDSFTVASRFEGEGVEDLNEETPAEGDA
ncbi:MAG TPA: ligase-associated DNA damage response exonuclease [Phycisphaerales bacterium]|nr:ligase-associated DNA damage response exonuclease [Phycisphaerales bacterium]